MNLRDACDIFNISDIGHESHETLKKKYRKLMVRYHPDNFGNSKIAMEIGEAYRLLKKIVDVQGEINKISDASISIIDLDEITDCEVRNKLNKNLYKNPYIMINTRYCIDGLWNIAVSILKYDIYDRYTVEIEIMTDNIEEKPLSIIVGGKNFDTTISTSLKIWTVTVGEVSITYRIRSIVYDE